MFFKSLFDLHWLTGCSLVHIDTENWTPGPKKAYPVANPLVFWYHKKAYPVDSGPQKSISIGLRAPKKHIQWLCRGRVVFTHCFLDLGEPQVSVSRSNVLVANPLVFWYPKKAYPLDSGPQKKHSHWTRGPKKAYPLDSGPQKSISSGKSLGFLVSQKSISIGLRAPKKHIHWTPAPQKAYPLDSGPQKRPFGPKDGVEWGWTWRATESPVFCWHRFTWFSGRVLSFHSPCVPSTSLLSLRSLRSLRSVTRRIVVNVVRHDQTTRERNGKWTTRVSYPSPSAGGLRLGETGDEGDERRVSLRSYPVHLFHSFFTSLPRPSGRPEADSGKSLGFLVSQKSISSGFRAPKKHTDRYIKSSRC